MEPKKSAHSSTPQLVMNPDGDIWSSTECVYVVGVAWVLETSESVTDESKKRGAPGDTCMFR